MSGHWKGAFDSTGLPATVAGHFCSCSTACHSPAVLPSGPVSCNRCLCLQLLGGANDATSSITKLAGLWLTWAGIALALFLINVITGLLAMVVVFPVLGHGTWHAYVAMRPGVEQPGTT